MTPIVNLKRVRNSSQNGVISGGPPYPEAGVTTGCRAGRSNCARDNLYAMLIGLFAAIATPYNFFRAALQSTTRAHAVPRERRGSHGLLRLLGYGSWVIFLSAAIYALSRQVSRRDCVISLVCSKIGLDAVYAALRANRLYTGYTRRITVPDWLAYKSYAKRVDNGVYGHLGRSQTPQESPTLIALRRLIYGVCGEFTERLGNYAYQEKSRSYAISRASKRCPLRQRISDSRNEQGGRPWILTPLSTSPILAPYPSRCTSASVASHLWGWDDG